MTQHLQELTQYNHHTNSTIAPKPQQQRQTQKTIQCRYCLNVHPPRQYPAYGKVCNKCGKNNHFSKACLSSPSATTAQTTTAHTSKAYDVTSQDVDVTHAVNAQRDGACNNKEWFINVDCKGNPLKLKVDTGAACNVMPKQIYDSLHSIDSKIVKHDQHLSASCRQRLNVLGSLRNVRK